ncbi:MAG: hypothetical protein E7654_05405 [Ruminococcaceae bacterium]|nr:hypothetical protein [Oscillospiraceae bacterium]
MKKRNYAAPMAVGVCLILYYIGFAALLLFLPGLVWWVKLLLGILPMAICGMVLYVLIQRIRELRSGETDDLDQY